MFKTSMLKSLSRKWFVAAVCCLCTTADAKPVQCDVCGGRLSKQYWTYNERTCCSQACIDELRPQCSVCGKVIRDDYRKSGGRIYCGKDCFLTSLPKCEICNSSIEKGFTVSHHQYCARCMEKQPGDRFQSVKDLAFELEEISSDAPLGVPIGPAAADHPSARRTRLRARHLL